MGKKIGVGFIGTGFARKVQMPAFSACENAEIISVASQRLGNAEAAAKEFGARHFTDKWQETISHPEVDLVCITTPPPLHKEMTLAALSASKHVLCEKPMAMNATEAEEMLRAANDSGCLTLIDHELRFQPGRIKAKEMILSGEIGEIYSMKYTFRAPHRGSRDIPWDWWSDAGQGGGALGAIVSHIIDSFYFFTEAEIEEVFCNLSTHIKSRPFGEALKEVTSDDACSLFFKFAQTELMPDADGLATVSMVEVPEYINQIEIFGSKGAIKIEHRGEVYTAKHGDKQWSQIPVNLGRGIEDQPDTGFSRGFMEFAPIIVNAILSGEKTIPSAADFYTGYRIQKVLDAARQSHKQRVAVRISEQGIGFRP
jgi:predicted dehydrogenase